MNKNDLAEKLEEYKVDLEMQEKAENSVCNYYRYANLFIKSIDHNNDLKKIDVMNFKKYVINVLEFSSSTTNHIIVCVNKFLHYCELDELKVKQIKVQDENTIDEIMTSKDFKRLLRISKKLKMYDMHMIMKVLAYTGIRNEELKYFTYEAIVSKEMSITVRNKGKTRKVPIRQDLRRELINYCKDNNITSGFIFPSSKNPLKMPHRSTIFRRLKKIAGVARVKKSLVYAHAFRHLFAITYLENGGNPLNLANILGHYSLSTTEKYTKLTQKQLRNQIEKIKY